MAKAWPGAFSCLRITKSGVSRAMDRQARATCRLVAIGLTRMRLASDRQGLHGLYVLLILDVALDDGERRPAHG